MYSKVRATTQPQVHLMISSPAMSRSKRPSLRKLVKTVFGITIQEGEHNSVIDARAPMALYRLYRKQWETGGVNEPSEGLRSFQFLVPTHR